MGYQVANKLEVSIFFNNVEYPLGARNLLNFLHMGASIKQQLPTIHFSITDTDQFISSLPDGIPIRVVIKVYQGKASTYTFRKFHSDRILNAGIYTYSIDGYWDSPLYWSGTECLGIRGTSNEVLQQIAVKCGFSFNGTTTSDSQLWLQQNNTYGLFAKKIKSHGYVNDGSCMALGIDFTNTMIYRNLNDASTKTKPVGIVAFTRSDTDITAIDFRVMANSGFNNQMSGYSSGLVVQSVVPPATPPATPTTPVDAVAVGAASTAIDSNSSSLTSMTSSLSTANSNLASSLGATIATQQAALNALLSSSQSVITGVGSLGSAIGTAASLASTLESKASQIITDTAATFTSKASAVTGLVGQVGGAQALINGITDAPSLAAAVASVQGLATSAVSGITSLSPASLSSLAKGGLDSAIALVIDKSSLTPVAGIASAAIADVIAASKSANTLVSGAISAAATAATTAAASGIALASASISSVAMSTGSSAISTAINSALKSAASQAQSLIKSQVSALQATAAKLPTFGPSSQGATSQPIENITFVADVKAPLLNIVVKDKAKRGSYSFSGVDSGNTHGSYDQAGYQNTRFSGLFSLKLEILLDLPSSIPLMGLINFTASGLDLKQSAAYSGIYIVESRAIYIQGTTYAEKLEVCRHGTNDAYING